MPDTQSCRYNLHRAISEKGIRRGSVGLSSGLASSYYFDLLPLLLDRKVSEWIGIAASIHIRGMFTRTSDYCYPPYVIGGPMISAIPMAMAVMFSCEDFETFFIRSEKKEHGTQRMVEASSGIPDHPRVVIIDDVMTSGKSAMQAVNACLQMEWDVLGTYVLVDRDPDSKIAARQDINLFMAMHNIEMESMFTVHDFDLT